MKSTLGFITACFLGLCLSSATYAAGNGPGVHGNGSGAHGNAPGVSQPLPAAKSANQPVGVSGAPGQTGAVQNGPASSPQAGKHGQGAGHTGPVQPGTGTSQAGVGQVGAAPANNAACIGKKGMTCPPNPGGASSANTTSPVNGAACNTAAQQCINPASGACISNHGQYISSLHKNGNGPQGDKTCGKAGGNAPAAGPSTGASSIAPGKSATHNAKAHKVIVLIPHQAAHSHKVNAHKAEVVSLVPHHSAKTHLHGTEAASTKVHKAALHAHVSKTVKSAPCKAKLHGVTAHKVKGHGAKNGAQSGPSGAAAGSISSGITVPAGNNGACVGKKGFICPPGPGSADYASPIGNGAICNSISQQCTNPAIGACISNHGQYISSLHKHGSGPPNMHRTCTRAQAALTSTTEECGTVAGGSTGTGSTSSLSGSSLLAGSSFSSSHSSSMSSVVHSGRSGGIARGGSLGSTRFSASMIGRSRAGVSHSFVRAGKIGAASVGATLASTSTGKLSSGVVAGSHASHGAATHASLPGTRSRGTAYGNVTRAATSRVARAANRGLSGARTGHATYRAAGRSAAGVAGSHTAVPSRSQTSRSAGGIAGMVSNGVSLLPRTGGAIGQQLSRLPFPVLPLALTLVLIGAGVLLRRFASLAP